MTTSPKSLCFSCIDPLDHSGETGDTGCFDLAPIRSGSASDLEREAAKGTSSYLISSEYFENGRAPSSTLFELTASGQPIRASTVAALCGGGAPYLWAPKQMVWQPGWIPSSAYYSATLQTSDGARYQFDESRSLIASVNREHVEADENALSRLRQRVEAEVTAWEWTHPFAGRCEGRTVDAPQEKLKPVDPDDIALGKLARARVLMTSSLVRGYYDRLPFQAVSVEYIPAITGIYGLFMLESRSIWVSADLFADMRRDGLDSQGETVMLGAVLAHEFGHARHFLSAGTMEEDRYRLASEWGLSPMVASLSQEILLKHQIPGECWGSFAGDVLGRYQMESGGHHKPTFSEFVARLYEIDFVGRQGMQASRVGKIIEKDFAASMQDISATYLRHVSAFPETAMELESLYWMVQLDPLLALETKKIGLHAIGAMAAATPIEGKIVWLQPPASGCYDAAYDAAHPPVDPAEILGPRWCDLNEFTKRFICD